MSERIFDRRTFLKGIILLPATPILGACSSPDTSCSLLQPSIRFETSVDESKKTKIDEVFKRIPPFVQNRVNREGYKIVVFDSEKAVSDHYGNSVGGLADYGKKEIIIGNSLDLTHELGHVVDFVFGDLSMSHNFLDPEIKASVRRAQNSDQRNNIKQLYGKEIDPQSKKLLADMIDQMDKTDQMLATLEALSKLPDPIIKAKIYTDGDLEGLVRHLYTPGFEAYYSGDQNQVKRFQKEDPELFAAFDNFDRNMRKLC